MTISSHSEISQPWVDTLRHRCPTRGGEIDDVAAAGSDGGVDEGQHAPADRTRAGQRVEQEQRLDPLQRRGSGGPIGVLQPDHRDLRSPYVSSRP